MMSGLHCVESCLDCHPRSRHIFCNLSQDSIAAFDKVKHAAVFPEHAVVLVEGQKPCGIFILCQGRAKLSTASREGKTLIVRIAEPGEILGLHAVVTGTPYELTVETMQPCQLNFVGREDMVCFLKEHADACFHATRHLARDCSDAYGVVRTIETVVKLLQAEGYPVGRKHVATLMRRMGIEALYRQLLSRR